MTIQHTAPQRSDEGFRPRGMFLLGTAIGFVALYLSTDFVAPNLASSSLPLPNDPVAEVRDWFAANRLAAVMIGVSQFLSVSFLAGFVASLRAAVTSERQAVAAAKARLWGLVAVGMMMVSTVCSWLLAAMAPTASLDTVSVLRTVNFISGGTAHVLALGLFVVLSARIPGMSKPVRVLGYVAAVPAVLSLLSLVVFQAAAAILLGRLLCMIWAISAAVSLIRRGRGPSDD